MTWNTNTLLEVSKRHVAILGMTGSGKTSTAKLFVQEIANADGRVCILDPIKSDWWGITSSKDGKHPGLPFVILGGPYAHVPLHSGAGKAVGDLVAAGKLPLSICDMVDLEPGGLAKFFIDFAPRFVRRRVLDVLESGPRKILEVLLRSPLEMARTQVAELAGFEPSGGTFQRYVSTLSSMELIRYPRRTTIAAATWMGGAETRK